MHGICFILSMFIMNVMSQCEYFKCDRENEKQVEYNGLVLDCPVGTYCNRLAKYDNCNLPCVKNPCESIFKCKKDDNTTVIIGALEFKCVDGFFCSDTKNPDCMPCVPDKCPETEKPLYECIPDNEKKFKLGVYIVECPGELVCNKVPEPPCSKPCIKGKSTSGSTTATATVATATTPVNEQPCTLGATKFDVAIKNTPANGQ